MKKVIIGLIACTGITSHAQSPTPEQIFVPTKTQTAAFEKTTAAIDRFMDKISSKGSCDEFKTLAEHFPYYRTWGHYQAVTPPPSTLQAKITDDIRTLEEEIVAIAQAEKSFVQEAPQQKEHPIVGWSKLTELGHRFFDQLNAYVQNKLHTCVPKNISFHFGNPSRHF